MAHWDTRAMHDLAGKVAVVTGANSGLGLETTDRSYIPDWGRWNFSGYEGKAAYPEYLVPSQGEPGTRWV